MSTKAVTIDISAIRLSLMSALKPLGGPADTYETALEKKASQGATIIRIDTTLSSSDHDSPDVTTPTVQCDSTHSSQSVPSLGCSIFPETSPRLPPLIVTPSIEVAFVTLKTGVRRTTKSLTDLSESRKMRNESENEQISPLSLTSPKTGSFIWKNSSSSSMAKLASSDNLREDFGDKASIMSKQSNFQNAMLKGTQAIGTTVQKILSANTQNTQIMEEQRLWLKGYDINPFFACIKDKDMEKTFLSRRRQCWVSNLGDFRLVRSQSLGRLTPTYTLGLSDPFALSATLMNYFMIGASALMIVHDREVACRLSFLMELALSKTAGQDTCEIQKLGIKDITTKWRNRNHRRSQKWIRKSTTVGKVVIATGFFGASAVETGKIQPVEVGEGQETSDCMDMECRKINDGLTSGSVEKEGVESNYGSVKIIPATSAKRSDCRFLVCNYLSNASVIIWDILLAPWPDLPTAPAYFTWRHEQVRDCIRANLLFLGITDILGTFIDPLNEALIVSSPSLCGDLGRPIRNIRLGSASFIMFLYISTWLPIIARRSLAMQITLVAAGSVRGLIALNVDLFSERDRDHQIHIALAIVVFRVNPEDRTRDMLSVSSVVGTFLLVCSNASLTMVVLGQILYGKAALSEVSSMLLATVLVLITLNRLRETGRQRVFALREALGY
ncbi:hypothetical protein BC829DRAFT_444757 [Chytridium lagenaria]|nr:hypothetical protein BC829DRAFT_444757 [Chytridium lagenaria]